jgi:hypothetical protein
MKNIFKQLAVMTALVASMATANASIITSTGNAALAGATLETFNSTATGDYASITLGSGVTVIGNGSPMTIDSTWTSAYGISGQSLNNSNSSPTSFDLIFSSTISAFGIWGGAVNNPWVYSAYDASNNLIESITTSGACCGPMFFGIANSNIKRVNLNGFGDWVIFDNLYFVSGSTVPEPASLALVGLGLIGVAAIRRRKNAA